MKRPPELAPPPGLAAFRLEADGEELVVLEVPIDAPVAPPGLTPAEREVAELAARGLGNAAIASIRGTSPRTVANQLARVYERLGVGSRAELAARCAPPRRGRGG